MAHLAPQDSEIKPSQRLISCADIGRVSKKEFLAYCKVRKWGDKKKDDAALDALLIIIKMEKAAKKAQKLKK